MDMMAEQLRRAHMDGAHAIAHEVLARRTGEVTGAITGAIAGQNNYLLQVLTGRDAMFQQVVREEMKEATARLRADIVREMKEEMRNELAFRAQWKRWT